MQLPVASIQLPVRNSPLSASTLSLVDPGTEHHLFSSQSWQLGIGHWQLVLLDASGKLSSIPCPAGGEPGVLARQLLGRTGETPAAPSFWRLDTMNQIHGN
jgi:hypothetical protein